MPSLISCHICFSPSVTGQFCLLPLVSGLVCFSTSAFAVPFRGSANMHLFTMNLWLVIAENSVFRNATKQQQRNESLSGLDRFVVYQLLREGRCCIYHLWQFLMQVHTHCRFTIYQPTRVVWNQKRHSPTHTWNTSLESVIILDFMRRGEDNRDKSTDNLTGPLMSQPPSYPQILCRMPFLPQPSQFIVSWDRHQICTVAYLEAWLMQIHITRESNTGSHGARWSARYQHGEQHGATEHGVRQQHGGRNAR